MIERRGKVEDIEKAKALGAATIAGRLCQGRATAKLAPYEVTPCARLSAIMGVDLFPKVVTKLRSDNFRKRAD
jgi:hypothetical protein